MCSVPVNEHKSTQYPPPSPPASKSSSLPASLFRRTIGNADVVESDGERWKLTSPIAMVMLRGVADDVIVVVVWRYISHIYHHLDLLCMQALSFFVVDRAKFKVREAFFLYV